MMVTTEGEEQQEKTYISAKRFGFIVIKIAQICKERTPGWTQALKKHLNYLSSKTLLPEKELDFSTLQKVLFDERERANVSLQAYLLPNIKALYIESVVAFHIIKRYISTFLKPEIILLEVCLQVSEGEKQEETVRKSIQNFVETVLAR